MPSPSSSFTWTLPLQVVYPTTPSTQPPPIHCYSPACLPTTATATLALVPAPADHPLGKRSTYQHHNHHSQSVSPSTYDRLAGNALTYHRLAIPYRLRLEIGVKCLEAKYHLSRSGLPRQRQTDQEPKFWVLDLRRLHGSWRCRERIKRQRGHMIPRVGAVSDCDRTRCMARAFWRLLHHGLPSFIPFVYQL